MAKGPVSVKPFIASTQSKLKSVRNRARPGSVQCTEGPTAAGHRHTAPDKDRRGGDQHQCVQAGNQEPVLNQSGGIGEEHRAGHRTNSAFLGEGAPLALRGLPAAPGLGAWRALRVTMHRKVRARKGFSAVVTGHTYSSRGPGPCKAGAGGRLTTWATAARQRESEKQKTKHHQSEQGYCQGNYSPTDEYT